jgi:hypothetical protein
MSKTLVRFTYNNQWIGSMEKNLRLEWLDPKTLKPNPKNWRLHPEKQKKILSAVMSEVGWAGSLLVNEQTGHVIDGHARREEAIARNEEAVPEMMADSKKNAKRLKLRVCRCLTPKKYRTASRIC